MNNYPNSNIRNVVFLNVKRMLKCQLWDLGYAIFKCPECGKEKIVPILVNLECVILVVINMVNNVLLQFSQSYSNVNIDMLSLLSHMN